MDEAKSDYGQELAHDLRQTYAKIVGEHLSDIADARKSENFYVWFKNLEDLHTIIKHKFKKKKEDNKLPEDRYLDLVKELVELANTHKSAWLGQSKDNDSNACANIEKKLREIEMFLYEQMNEAKMFGSSAHVAGL